MTQTRKPITLPKGKKSLVTIVGAAAAGMLFMTVPADESGRKVAATVNADESVTLTHVAGKQYLKAYLDIVGVPTACDGITLRIKMGQTFTEQQCAELLEREIIAHAEPLMKAVPALKGRPYQIVGGVGLTFNVGVQRTLTSSIVSNWKAGRWAAGCDRLLAYTKAGGRTVRGLVLRRNREREYCLTGLRPGYTPQNLHARLAKWES